MPTVFKRISYYCQQNGLPIPDRDQRAEVGKQVAHIYISEKKKEAVINRIESVEPEGTFSVIDYPKNFVPVIDQFIDDFMKELTPKKRKRNPIEKPVYSGRKQNQ